MEVVDLFEILQASAPNDVGAATILAKAYSERGEDVRAREAWRKAAEIMDDRKSPPNKWIQRLIIRDRVAMDMPFFQKLLEAKLVKPNSR